MTDNKLSILKQIREVEKSIRDAVRSKKTLMGQLKDNLSDKLDKIKENVSDLKDEKKINAATEKKLKKILENIKSQLDVDLDD